MRLRRMRAALAAMSDEQLQALRAASEQTTDLAPGLFAWLEHAVGWEIDRRDDQDYVLRLPDEALVPHEVPKALDALHAIAETFRTRGGSPELDELFAAAAEVLRGEGSVH